MESNLNQARARAHALLDLLRVDQLDAVSSLLEVMIEPLAVSLASAPEEDEAVSPGTARAIDRARASLARGERISHEEVLREFGLSH